MRGTRRILAAAAVLAAGTAAAAPTGGPVAVYWVSAQTSTGMMAAMMGAKGHPSRQAIMAMAMGGGAGPGEAQHSLHLQLGSERPASGPPAAEHDPPQGLGVGPRLPLVTPVAERSVPEDSTPRTPEQFQRPSGRLLIYWGCGEHAGPGQPAVIDFAKLRADPRGFAAMMHGLASTPMQPPSARRFATYGEWPNPQSSPTVPSQASLVGEHAVRGNYTPNIDFSLSPDQDFMAPLRLTTNDRIGSGAVQLAWTPVPTTLGYFASVMGGGGGAGGNTVVIWTSANVQTMAFAIADYLPPGEARRLVHEGRLMSPQTTACAVPAEVVQQVHGLVSLVAYGDEANFAYPPRTEHPVWTVKVRYRSATSGLLGQPDPMSRGGDRGDRGEPDERDRPPPPNRGPAGLLQGLGGLGAFIP